MHYCVHWWERSRGSQHIPFWNSLCKWMNEQVPEQNVTLANMLETARDRRDWKTVITYILKARPK